MTSTFGFVVSLVIALLLQIVALPDWLALARPVWPLLVIGYWALYVPAAPALAGGWLLGLCMDVLLNAPLGQHALGLTVAVFVVRQLRSIYVLFPLWQAAIALTPVWALYVFLMFWIDGLTDHRADPTLRWLPVVTTAVLWPIYSGLAGGMRARRMRDLNRMTL